MSILTQLTEEMKVAMKARDMARLSAVRMLISSIKYAMVDKPDLDEQGVISILTKEAKKRKEAATAYRSAGREEQAQSEEMELALILAYLPKMLDEHEIKEELAKLNLAGLSIGEAIKKAMSELKGRAEGGVVSKVVRELLGQ